MDYFPIFLDAKKMHCVVIGAGQVAARKIELLLKSQAGITVLSSATSVTVDRLISHHKLKLIKADYDISLLPKQTNLVIAATNNNVVNSQIAQQCQQRNILVNVVDSPELCSYITPAIIDREPMLIALSSSGQAPMMLQLLKQQIDQLLPASYGVLATFLGDKRKKVQQQIPSFAQRRQFWQNVINSDLNEYLTKGDIEKAELQFSQLLGCCEQSDTATVTLITVFSDNPDTLTLQAYRQLQSSDQVFISAELQQYFNDYCRRDAEKVSDWQIADVMSARQRVNTISVLVHSDSKMADKLTLHIAQQHEHQPIRHIVCGR
ncbi:bifunctional precorrin-2 dehydrogenase/sirohydrochlorin ferrochelatase [Thalassotalea maritima]|uniref:precorrin-2 dehydrogenase/sirohydrochlorin ferrochelatase family protein n=1 Tax=Thalassotalea maritima TaxID=3242416 RepID=UPI0035295A09